MDQERNHGGDRRLRVLELAVGNVGGVKRVIRQTADFGGLHAQMARSAVSVVSLIEEGDGQRTQKARREYFARARGSNKELAVQLRMLLDENQAHPLHDAVDQVGRMLSNLIARLE